MAFTSYYTALNLSFLWSPSCENTINRPLCYYLGWLLLEFGSKKIIFFIINYFLQFNKEENYMCQHLFLSIFKQIMLQHRLLYTFKPYTYVVFLLSAHISSAQDRDRSLRMQTIKRESYRKKVSLMDRLSSRHSNEPKTVLTKIRRIEFLLTNYFNFEFLLTMLFLFISLINSY